MVNRNFIIAKQLATDTKGKRLPGNNIQINTVLASSMNKKQSYEQFQRNTFSQTPDCNHVVNFQDYQSNSSLNTISDKHDIPMRRQQQLQLEKPREKQLQQIY